MIRLERGRRDSFLINKKPTQTEVWQVRALLEQIEWLIASSHSLFDKFNTSRCKGPIGSQTWRETVFLLVTHEYLKEIIGHNEILLDWFIFEVVKAQANMEKTLSRTCGIIV